MKRKASLLLITSIAAFILASCSSNSPENSAVEPTEKSAPKQSSQATEKVNGIAVKTEKDILADLEENHIYTFFDAYCIDDYGNFAGSDYSLQNLEITRRKVDKDAATDDVYVTLSAKSESCGYTGSFHLSYSLYDVGGWYLENIELEHGVLEPLSNVPEDAARDIVLELLRILGAGASDIEIFNELHPTPMEESLVFKLDFNDGVLAVSGNIALNFEHNGRGWNYVDSEPNLYYDILLDGTYLNRRAYQTYLTFTHRNGSLEIWSAYDTDPFYRKDWAFDPFTRSLETNSALDNDHYFFDYDGLIYAEDFGIWWGAFTRISDPITDASVLRDYLSQAKIPHDGVVYESSEIVSANFIPSTRPGEFPQLAPIPLPDQTPQNGAAGVSCDEIDPYLLEFAELCCSDPSALWSEDENEYNAFLQAVKEDYAQWLAGTEYHYIVMDNTGHLTIDYDIAEAEGIVGLW